MAATPLYARTSADGRQGSPANPRVLETTSSVSLAHTTWLLLEKLGFFTLLHSRYGRLAQSETEAHVTNGVLQADSLSVADHELDHRLLVILITIAVSTSRYV